MADWLVGSICLFLDLFLFLDNLFAFFAFFAFLLLGIRGKARSRRGKQIHNLATQA